MSKDRVEVWYDISPKEEMDDHLLHESWHARRAASRYGVDWKDVYREVTVNRSEVDIGWYFNVPLP